MQHVTAAAGQQLAGELERAAAVCWSQRTGLCRPALLPPDFVQNAHPIFQHCISVPFIQRFGLYALYFHHCRAPCNPGGCSMLSASTRGTVDGTRWRLASWRSIVWKASLHCYICLHASLQAHFVSCGAGPPPQQQGCAASWSAATAATVGATSWQAGLPCLQHVQRLPRQLLLRRSHPEPAGLGKHCNLLAVSSAASWCIWQGRRTGGRLTGGHAACIRHPAPQWASKRAAGDHQGILSVD